VDLWADNDGALTVCILMGLEPGFNGPSGLRWGQLDRALWEARSTCRIGRRDKRELVGWLHRCEGWAMDWVAEQRANDESRARQRTARQK
jgi:hypothetical protein